MFILISLSSCSNNQEQIKVIVPNGVPSIAQSYMEYHQENTNYVIERVSGPSPLLAAFTSKSHDIIIAPINVGANLYNKGTGYKLAGLLTWTNFQIISKNPIDINNLENYTIISYGKAAVPEIILDYLFEQINPNIEINFDASSVQEAYLRFMQEENLVAIISEPVTTTAILNDESLYTLDLAQVWEDYTEYDLFPQAGVFVSEDLSDSQVSTYLRGLQSAASYTLNNPEEVSSYCESMDYPFSLEVIRDSITKSNIAFLYASDEEQVINDFLQMIYDFKPELIGNAIPSEDFIWQK
jgi:NitT/TauT family transport system substrate-binding protein